MNSQGVLLIGRNFGKGKMKKELIVIGAYGCGNKGDDAILEGFQNMLGNEYKLVPTCGNYGGLSEILDGSDKFISCRMNEGLSRVVLMNLLKFFPRYFKELGKAEAVIIGGGSLLHDITRYNLPFFFILQILARIRRKKVMYVGVGAGPIQTNAGKKLAKHYLNKSNGVFIREVADYALLKNIGVRNIFLSADMAFSVTTDLTAADNILKKLGVDKKEYIVVTACQWFKSDNFWERDCMDFSSDRKKLAMGIQKLISTYQKKVLFLPTVFHDYKLGEQLERDLNTSEFRVVDHRYNCKVMASIVANSWLVFGMRMHSIIFAIRSGVPFITTVYDNKVHHLLERVKMLDYACEFDKLGTKEFEEILEKLVDSYDDVAEHLKIQAESLSSVVSSNMKILKRIIQR